MNVCISYALFVDSSTHRPIGSMLDTGGPCFNECTIICVFECKYSVYGKFKMWPFC